MQLSLNWLKRHIDLDMDPEKISEILTDIGLEVEGMEKVESIKGGLKGVVVGEIKSCEKHPNADKLSVTMVDYGIGEDVQIVCGAPNVATGQKVLIATPGTLLYDDEGKSFKIKKGKIRGEVSAGMICAADELGLGTDHSGIMVLDGDIVVGTLAKDVFEIMEDVVYDIGLTPNRSDATNHLGSAKDLLAYMKVHDIGSQKLHEHAYEINASGSAPGIEVEIKDTDLCPRYSGILLKNLVVKESPDFIQQYLLSIGVRPINNVVDITNFVLHDMGQALHAFDADKIKGGKIIVSTLAEGTPFLSLDEKERKLLAGDLMICDGEMNPMCIAGVFGGLNSGVTDQTQNVFLEAAHFNPVSIRVTSMKHNLRTDAAKVFEKGSDPNITVTALEMAVHLLQEYGEAEVASSLVDLYPNPISKKEVSVSYNKIVKWIGEDLSYEDIDKILNALEIDHVKNGDEIVCQIPTNKADVTRDVDIIEEILRIYGFNNVPIPSKLSSTLLFSEHPSKRSFVEHVSNWLSSNGCNEMMGLSLIESKKYEEIGYVSDDSMIQINNTSNVHLNILRPDMLVSGLETIRHNLNHQQNDLKLFELGKSYVLGEHKQDEDNGPVFVEREMITLFLTGFNGRESWRSGDQTEFSFYDIKAIVDQLFSINGLTKYQESKLSDERFAQGISYHQGRRKLADFGKLDRSFLKKSDIDRDVYFAELDVVHLFQSAKKHSLSVDQISKYPVIRRDLALVVGEQVDFSAIEKIMKKCGKQLLQEVDLFDVYRHPEQIGENKKSYAIKLIFSDSSRTLNDKEIDGIMGQIIKQTEAELSAKVR